MTSGCIGCPNIIGQFLGWTYFRGGLILGVVLLLGWSKDVVLLYIP